MTNATISSKSIAKQGIQSNFFTSVNSPTYNLALYVVHPSVSNDPEIYLGEDKINSTLNDGRAELIAQSGVTTDFYIDNVVLTSFARTSSAIGNVATTSINFDIVEPYEFRLMEELLRYAKKFKFGNMQNALYVMKLDFKGRDPVTDRENKYPTTHFYPLIFTNISSSIGPDGARYNILANMNAKSALSQAKIVTDISFNCTTVRSLVENLTIALNQYEKEIRDAEDLNILDVAKTWKINLSDEVKDFYQNISLVGLKQNETDTYRSNSPGAAIEELGIHMTVAAGPIITYVRDILASGLAKHLVNNGHIIKVQPTIKHFQGIDSETGQLKKTIILDIHLDHINPPSTQIGTPSIDRHMNANSGRDADFSKAENRIETDRNFLAKRKNINKVREKFSAVKEVLHKKYDYLHTGTNTEILDIDLNYNLLYFDQKAPGSGKGYKDQSKLIKY